MPACRCSARRPGRRSPRVVEEREEQDGAERGQRDGLGSREPRPALSELEPGDGSAVLLPDGRRRPLECSHRPNVPRERPVQPHSSGPRAGTMRSGSGDQSRESGSGRCRQVRPGSPRPHLSDTSCRSARPIKTHGLARHMAYPGTWFRAARRVPARIRADPNEKRICSIGRRDSISRDRPRPAWLFRNSSWRSSSAWWSRASAAVKLGCITTPDGRKRPFRPTYIDMTVCRPGFGYPSAPRTSPNELVNTGPVSARTR
jgi:hypothetical protein